MESEIAQLIWEITNGRPYVFMLMPFGSRWHLFERIKSLVGKEAGLACIRADDIPGSGFDLLEKIHTAIEKAELVIAEISERNSNVFYELGYSVGLQKPILLVAQDGADIPSDVRGRELILYSESRQSIAVFEEEFAGHIRQRLNSQNALLRDMLEAERPRPIFIAASPKYPNHRSRIPGQPRDNRTFGDNLGILGLLSAFGSIFGERNEIELVSAQFCSDDLSKRDTNLFLIGSPKVNFLVEDVMNTIQVESPLRWIFAPAAGETGKSDYFLSLYRVEGSNHLEIKGRNELGKDGEIHVEDYGIIIRAPHPKHAGRLIMVMAGAHSLGTGAACLAATRSSLIREIKSKGINIADRQQAFWVLVRGVSSEHDGLLDVAGARVVEAGTFPRLRSATAS